MIDREHHSDSLGQMEADEKNERRKPGPVPISNRRQTNISIDDELAEWAKRQPGGMSELIRELLKKAKAEAEKKGG